MSKKFRVLINTATTEKNQILEIEQGASYQGKALRIKAIAGDKYQLQEIGKGQSFAPESIKAKRVGKHLHIIFEGSKDADLIIEDYYEVMAKGYNGMVGRAENGNFYEYLTQDPNEDGMIGHLNEGMQAVSQALGGSEVSGAGAAVGVLVAGVNPLMGTLGLAGVGVAAAAAAPGTTTALASTTIGSVTDNEGNPNDASEALVNGGVTNDKTPTLTGKAPAGSVITIKDGSTVLGTTTTDANGNWSFTPATALAEGKRSLTAESTTNGTTNVSAVFAITVDTTAPVGSIGIDAITGDDYLTVSETAGTVTITGTVTGEYKSGDVVTIKVRGAATIYSTTVNAAGKYTMAGVLATELAANTQVDASVLAHDGAWNSTYTKTRLYTVDNKPDALQTALSLNPVAGDNIITVNKSGMNTTTLAGKATGSFDAGDVVTLSVNDKTFTGTVGANGNYNIDVATADLVADADTKVEARIAATVGSHKQTAVAAQDYVVESSSTAGQQTGLSIDPITVDNIIHSAESNGGTIIEGQVTGAFVINDIVTIMANGNAYTGTADGYGNFRIVVPSAQLVADVNTQVEGRITGTGGSVANAMQNYAVNLNVAPINTLPDAQAIDEDTPLALSGLNVSDADGNLASTQLSVLKGKLNVTLAGSASISAGSNGEGTLTLSGSQADINATLASLKYTGAGNYNGADTLRIVSKDSLGATSATNTVAITVTAVNDAPTNIVPGAKTVAEDTQLALSGLSVSDVDGNLASTQLSVLNGNLNVTLVGSATISAGGNGTLTLSGSQADINATLDSLKYTGASNYNGADTLIIVSKDSLGATSATNTVAITVTAVNDAPVAVADTASATEAGGTANTVAGSNPSGNVLSNDTDVDNATSTLVVKDILQGSTGTAISVSASTSSANGTSIAGNYGTLVIGADGTYTYTVNQANATVQALNAGGSLNDVFTYTVKDPSGLTSTATLTVAVNGTNDTATISGTTTGAVSEDATTNTATGILTVTDVDTGEAMLQTPTSATLVGTYGNFTLNTATGTWVYTLDNSKAATQALPAGQNVIDTLNVTSKDGTATQAITVTVTGANDAATISGTTTGAVTEDATTNTATGTLTVADVDTGEALLQTPTSATLAGTYGNFTLNTATGTWVYTLDNSKAATQALPAGQNVIDTLNVTSKDGTATQAITVTVTGANDAPTNIVPGAKTVAEDTQLALSGLSVSDVDGNLASTQLSVLNGNLNVTLVGSATISAGGNGTLTLSGSQADINATLDSLKYTGASNYNGADTLSIVSKDSLGATSATNTVAINVTALNDAPTGGSTVVTILEDGSKNFPALDFSFADGSDSPANALQAVIITTLPTAGTLKLGGTAVTAGQSIAVADLGGLVYAPAANASGEEYASIYFKLQDNGGTDNGGKDTMTGVNMFVFNVTAVNDAPVLADTPLALPAVMQDSADPIGAVGSLVSDLVGGATDVDAGAAKGIAITGVANGTLYYSTDGGTSWAAFTDTASDSNALLLGSDADNRIYLKPTAAYSGTANDVTFRAWDQTTGTEGSYVSTETNGGTTAFSSATDTISELVVRAVTINTVSTDNIVAMNEAVPLTGTANPGATVNLTVNSTARSVVADASGNWSYDTKLKPVVRYVMVRKTVDGSAAIDPLSQNAAFDVSEISVMSGGVNVAAGQAATYGMGQTTSTTSSAAMTDNDTSTYLEASEEGEQWVQVDLGAYYRIDSITAYSRVDLGLRLNGATIYASGENLAGQTTAQLTTASTTGNVVSYAVTGLSNVLSQASYFSAVPTYSGTSADAFINGNNVITAAQSVSGLASNASSTVTWRPYDQITITDVVASGATLPMGSGSLVCGLTPTFHGELVGALPTTQTVGIRWRLPGDAPTPAQATVTGTSWSWTVPSGLMSAGTYQIEAQLEDMNLGSTLQTSGTFFITLASTPLVLDLNGDGVQTTSLNEGTQFDLLNTGKKINVGWVSKQDGLLAMDLNGDGSINSGAELFGDHTVLADGTLASNGWVALSAQDSNHDGKIDAQDANFDKLRVWVDANGDGVTDAGELHTLADEHIASINLNHDNSSVQQNGNLVQMASSFTTTDGARHSVADVGFMVQNATSNLFTLTGGNNLDLSGLGNVGMVSAIDMRNDTSANTVKLTLADVMGIATTHGVHVLKLTGDANDSVQLTASEWAHTGTTVSDGAHTYAVYGSTTDVFAQLLIDLDMRY